jgi:hypothetical protein
MKVIIRATFEICTRIIQYHCINVKLPKFDNSSDCVRDLAVKISMKCSRVKCHDDFNEVTNVLAKLIMVLTMMMYVWITQRNKPW